MGQNLIDVFRKSDINQIQRDLKDKIKELKIRRRNLPAHKPQNMLKIVIEGRFLGYLLTLIVTFP